MKMNFFMGQALNHTMHTLDQRRGLDNTINGQCMKH